MRIHRGREWGNKSEKASSLCVMSDPVHHDIDLLVDDRSDLALRTMKALVRVFFDRVVRYFGVTRWDRQAIIDRFETNHQQGTATQPTALS